MPTHFDPFQAIAYALVGGFFLGVLLGWYGGSWWTGRRDDRIVGSLTQAYGELAESIQAEQDAADWWKDGIQVDDDEAA